MSLRPDSVPGHELPLEELLAHQGFLYSLAQRLVGNDPDADDLVQDAWLATLQGPQVRGTNVRAWLRRVAHNRWLNRKREEHARAHRERNAARTEAFDPEPAERGIEQRQRVLEAVRSLPEPYRTTIFLRYYEERSYADVAARTSATEDTARSRVRRGIALLRERLDKTFGARGAWVAALGEWRGPGNDAGAAAATVGQPALVPGTAWLGTTAFVGSLALLAIVGWRTLPQRSSSEATPAAPSSAREGRADLALPAPSTTARTPMPRQAGVDAAPASATLSNSAASVTTPPRPGVAATHTSVDYRVLGRVVGPDGVPVPGASLYTALVGWLKADAEGRFELPVEVNTYTSAQRSMRPAVPLVVHHPGFAPALIPDLAALVGDDPAAPQRVELALGQPPRNLSGVVLTNEGRAAAGWRVTLQDSTASFPGLADARVTLESLAGGQPRILDVDADGRFRLAGLLDRSYRLIAWEPRSLAHVVTDIGTGPLDVLELRAPAPSLARRVAGRVTSRSGAALAGARVWARLPLLEERHVFMAPESAHGAEVFTDALGHFELEAPLFEPLPLVIAGDGLVLYRYGSDALRTTEDWASLELVVPRRCEVVLDARSSEPPAALLAFLDADGAKLLTELPPEEHASMGGLAYWRAVPLPAGIARRTVHTNEDAVIALFYDGDGTEIERRAVSPSPDRSTVLTW